MTVDQAAIDEIEALHQRGEHEDVLSAVERLLGQEDLRLADVAIGQVCRRAMVASVELDPEGADGGEVWRARALAAYAKARSRNGTAMVLLSDAYKQLPSQEAALQVLGVMDDLATEDDPHLPAARVQAAAAEARGNVYLSTWGDGSAIEEMDLARRAFADALVLQAGDARRSARLKASSASCRYLAGEAQEALEALENLDAELTELGERANPIRATVAENMRRMRAGSSDLVPYETT